MTYFGNLKINTNPCTDQDQRRNWDIANQLFQAIINQGTIDNYTVCVDTTDTEPAFLNDKLYNQGAYVAGTHQDVYAEIYVDAGVRKVRLFTPAAAGAGTDDKTILVSGPGTDTTNDYLYPKFYTHATYEASKDVIVAVEIEPTSVGGNEKIRAFLDVSTITGYSATVTRILACVGGNTRFIDLDNFYSEIWDAFNAFGALEDKERIIRGTAIGTVSTSTPSFTIDNVEPLANGLDPTLGNPATTVTIYNVHSQSYANNEAVEAAWNPDTSHWEGMLKAEDGADGASGTFVCTLSADIAAATPGSMTAGSGTVYSVGQNGALSSVGTRDIYNPFTVEAAASNAQYTCAKTYDHPTDESQDEYTIIGLDIMAVLYNLTGAGAAKTLAIPETGSGADDIQWLGGEC